MRIITSPLLAKTARVISKRQSVLKKILLHSVGLAMLFGVASLYQPSPIKANVCGEIVQEVGGIRCIVNTISYDQYRACVNDVVGGRCCIGTGAIAACNAPTSTVAPTPRPAADCASVTGCGSFVSNMSASACYVDGCQFQSSTAYLRCGRTSPVCCVASTTAEQQQMCQDRVDQTVCGIYTPSQGGGTCSAGGNTYTWTQMVLCGSDKPGARCCVGPEASQQCQEFESTPYELCAQIQDGLVNSEGKSLKVRCEECHEGTVTGQSGIWTAVGCIPTNAESIVSVVVRLGLGMGGGFALLNILAAGFILTISQGNPKQTDEAKQQLTAALTGLLFIIFSVVLLHFIGYTVFRIPGFGE